MRPEERDEFRDDGLSAERRASFLAGEAAAREWERRWPRSMEDYLDFLASLQELFGPFPVSREPWPGTDFRL